jgi:hypothetical protein
MPKQGDAGTNLLPLERLHRTMPRCCATCAQGAIEEGSFFCRRPEGPSWDAGDLTHWLRICDRYAITAWAAQQRNGSKS